MSKSNESFALYADWFRAAICCAECAEADCTVNANIFPDTATDPETGLGVTPQAGFAEMGWFAERDQYRVLILGLNPKGGRKIYTKPGDPDGGDTHLYGTYYRQIRESGDTATVLQELMPALEALVCDYRPNLTFMAKLGELIAEETGKTAAVAYANQLLCRTTPEAGELGDVSQIYENCFRSRVLPLIRILVPDLVVVLGWTRSGTGWAQQYFRPLAQAAVANGTWPGGTEWIGVQHTSRANNRDRALERIRTRLDNHIADLLVHKSAQAQVGPSSDVKEDGSPSEMSIQAETGDTREAEAMDSMQAAQEVDTNPTSSFYKPLFKSLGVTFAMHKKKPGVIDNNTPLRYRGESLQVYFNEAPMRGRKRPAYFAARQTVCEGFAWPNWVDVSGPVDKPSDGPDNGYLQMLPKFGHEREAWEELLAFFEGTHL